LLISLESVQDWSSKASGNEFCEVVLRMSPALFRKALCGISADESSEDNLRISLESVLAKSCGVLFDIL
jgi:hypothetical protein